MMMTTAMMTTTKDENCDKNHHYGNDRENTRFEEEV